MNKIQQIAEQAKAGVPKGILTTDKWIEEYNRIFAELIIQECVKVCNAVYFDNYPDAEDFERSEEGDAIKKHFGVK